jgi:hypothetical protein
MDYFVTRNKRSASSGTQPPASRPRIIEETESERNITAIPIEVNIQQSDEDRDHSRENMFDDVPQDVIIMEHDTDDIKITVFDDTQEGRIILTSTHSASTSASAADIAGNRLNSSNSQGSQHDHVC